MVREFVETLTGGQELLDWFGRLPRFHDAELQAIELIAPGTGRVRMRYWNMTGVTDANGFYICDKHAIVMLTLTDVSIIDLHEFQYPGIVGEMTFEDLQPGVLLSWEAAYGVQGRITAGNLEFELEPYTPPV